jgi:hypothetical protein
MTRRCIQAVALAAPITAGISTFLLVPSPYALLGFVGAGLILGAMALFAEGAHEWSRK